MTLAWGARVSALFRRLVTLIAQEGGFDPSDLMAVIAFETGRTFSAKARNPISGATGLLQFIRSTAEGMGWTLDELSAMSDEEQLRLAVRKYLQPYYGRCRTLSDLYMAVLWPKAVGQPESFVLFSEGSAAYLQNKGLDVDRDGKITKAEATAYVEKQRKEGLRPENATVEERVRTNQEEVTQMETGTTTAQGIGGLLGMLHPAAGILFNVFAPALKQKITEKVDGVSGTPGAGQAVADALSAALLGSAKEQTGKTDELEAVAVARQNPEMVAKAQEAAVVAIEERLKQLAPVLAQSVEWDKEKWKAEQEGKRTSSKIAIAEKKAGLWDMTKTLVSNTEGQVWFILVALASGVGGAFYNDKDALAYALLTLAGPILGQVMKNKSQPNDYRFDGTKESGEQTKALTSMMQQASEDKGAS